MTQTIQDQTRKQIAEFLPEAITRTLNSYYTFAKKKPSEDPKEFSSHHTACKVAIAHIELLIKLAKWAELPDETDENKNRQIMLAAMMQQAQAELDGFKEKNGEEEEEE